MKLPQLSPDGRYIAHLLSNDIYQDDYLAITDLVSGETRRLTTMGFKDGFKWDLSGNRIVYQRRVDNEHKVITNDINIRLFEQLTIADNKLYYVPDNTENSLMIYDFDTGVKTDVKLNGINPTRIEMVDHELYIRDRRLLTPKLMVGTLEQNCVAHCEP